MKVAVVGAGYVGLVTSVGLAELGHHVTCIDVNRERVEQLQSGVMPIFEPGLEAMVTCNTTEGRLWFTSSGTAALKDAKVVLIAVGTPPLPDGNANLSAVWSVVDMIAANAQRRSVVIMKSTVPVGTCDQIQGAFDRACGEKRLSVVSSPEFLREGSALDDFFRPDRILIGSSDRHARNTVSSLMQVASLSGVPIIHTSKKTAELVKYASNAFLAMKVAFINEMSDLCEAAGADVAGLAHGVGSDKRIGDKFLSPGPGFGGSCFPKDCRALGATAKRLGAQLRLVDAVTASNEARKQMMADRVVSVCDGEVLGKKVAVLGLAFKSDTDDVRESPSLAIIDSLLRKGARVSAFDPAAMQNARAILSNVDYRSNAYEAASGADVLVVLTEWPHFKELDLVRLRTVMVSPRLVDFRNVFSATSALRAGFLYFGIGRGKNEKREKTADLGQTRPRRQRASPELSIS